AEIALISVPGDTDLIALARAVYAEIGGGALQALSRAQRGLEAVQRAEAAGTGPGELARIASRELGTPVVFSPLPSRSGVGIPVSGWHLAVRVEADDLDEAEQDEVRRFELLEAAGQAALQAVAGGAETWYLSRIARAIVLIRVTTSNPGPQAGVRAARSAERALEAIGARLPALRFRAGVGAAHEGPTGLRASAAEARGALAAARA